MTRIALLVGIDRYPDSPLSGCVNDADRMAQLLARNYDDSPNIECRTLLAGPDSVTRSVLREAIADLFARPADVALLFFAGHGTHNNLGGFLVTEDASRYEEGVAMTEVLQRANDSPAGERIVILDTCHSGAFGAVPGIANDAALLREGVSILSAARATEAAVEDEDGGLFTSLVLGALEGGGADVCGDVSIASVYAYADQALGGFEQRPLFKSHVAHLVPLRKCHPAVEPEVLRLLPRYFPAPARDFPLDPSYEPTAEPRNLDHEAAFRNLQQLRDARLVVPVGEDHMYYAAMNSTACRLTPLGRFYWRVASEGRL